VNFNGQTPLLQIMICDLDPRIIVFTAHSKHTHITSIHFTSK